MVPRRAGQPSFFRRALALARQAGIFSSGARDTRVAQLRTAVNEALTRSGVGSGDLVFQKTVGSGTPTEYEYREFLVSRTVRLDQLAARLERNVRRLGARVIGKKVGQSRGRRVLALDTGFGGIKRQCLLIVQPTKKAQPPRPAPAASGRRRPASTDLVAPGASENPATLAIIIDDCGYDLGLAKRVLRIGCPLTLSILPEARFATATALLARARGCEAMLHLPMEPVVRTDPNIPDLEVRLGQRRDEIEAIVQEALDAVPGAVGVNNHEGSKATADLLTMMAVMRALRDLGLFFVDSKTTPDSKALLAARRVGVRAASRTAFLDNENDAAAIVENLDKLVELGQRAGRPLIGICHLRPKTVAVLEERLPLLRLAGHRFLLGSQAVKQIASERWNR